MRKFTLAITTLLLLALFSGCAGEQRSQAAEEPRTGAEEDQPWVSFGPEDLGGKTSTSITYWHLSQVNIRVDGVELPLADAIRSGTLE